MRADELLKRFDMEKHVENGRFLECHYPHRGSGRAASGYICYYVAPGERTEFHRIDCDEYWCFHAGEAAELYVIGLDGRLRVTRCGISEGAEPTVRFAAGELFASRLPADAGDGCFLSCITVPRFTYEGFEMLGREEVLAICPEAASFWED